MKKKLIVPLSINLFLILILGIFLGVKKLDTGIHHPLVKGITIENIDEIILNGPVSWVYKKEKGIWYLYKNNVVRIPLKNQYVENILQTLVSLTTSKPAAINMEHPELWGLTEEQALLIQIKDSDKSYKAFFHLGMLLSGKNSCFLQIPGEDEVYKVPALFLDLIKQNKIADRRFFPEINDVKNIQRYTLKVSSSDSDMSYTLLKRSGTWVFYGNETALVDQKKVQQIISETAGWITDGFIPRESGSDYGLDSPLIEIILETHQGEIYSILLGNVYGQRAFYAQSKDLFQDEKSAVYLIPVEILEKTLLPKAQLLLQK